MRKVELIRKLQEQLKSQEKFLEEKIMELNQEYDTQKHINEILIIARKSIDNFAEYIYLLNNQEKEIAVILDEYGDASIETVDIMPCQERIARKARHEGQGQEAEETREIRSQYETQGKEYKHNIAHQVQEIEKTQKDANQTVEANITPDDRIPNTEMTWGELMESTGDSLPKLIERYNRDMAGREPEDSQDVVDTIESDYGNVQHEHKR